MKTVFPLILICVFIWGCKPSEPVEPSNLTPGMVKKEIVEGVITCQSCKRWYPIIDEIPHMLPDELRDGKDDLPFMKKWKGNFPESTLKDGKPFNGKNI